MIAHSTQDASLDRDTTQGSAWDPAQDKQDDFEAFERVLHARVRAQFFEAWKRIFLLRWLRRLGLTSSLAIQDQFDLTDD